MQTVTTVGLDVAKSVFQVHGVDAGGQVVIRRQLKRRYVLAFFQKLPRCVVGIEACASSHHWSRELQALSHTVRLMPPAYVKPYVKRQKNDAIDAEAICEAVTRANMRFVPTWLRFRFASHNPPSGLIAVARLAQGIPPKHCSSPARRAEGFWRCLNPSVFHPAAALENPMSNVTLYGFPRSTFVKVCGLILTARNVEYRFRDT
jgi:hypothetical protein